jgi:hypothetical protein
MAAVAAGGTFQASAALEAMDLIAVGSTDSPAETPTETPMQTPMPTPIPIPQLVVDPGPLTAGAPFTVSISLI